MRVNNSSKPTSGLTYTQKLSLMAGSAAALYLVPTEAQGATTINYFNTPLKIDFTSTPVSVPWDVDGGGQTDFELKRVPNNPANPISFLRLLSSTDFNTLRGSGLVVNRLNQKLANISGAIPVGATLLPNNQWRSVGLFNFVTDYKTKGSAKAQNLDGFKSVTAGGKPTKLTGQFGFRFKIGNNTHYGWAGLEVNLDQTAGRASNFIITQWAYDSTPNQSIKAGDTGTPLPPTSVPEPTSSLALLAFGAAGIYRWRKERKD